MDNSDNNIPGGSSEDICRTCGGCISCGETYCMFNSNGNPESCNMARCRYCVLFSQKQRLFLGNVG